MRRVIYIIILIAFILGLFAYLRLSSNQKKSVETTSKVTVQLKWINQAQFAGFYFAKESGMYKKVGLDVELVPGGPEISPIQSVVTGSSQFGIIGADQILLAREKGVPIVAVAVIYKDNPVAFASLEKSNITKPSDFKGKTLAMVYGKDEEITCRALLDRESISRDQIKEVPLTFDLSQITTGKVDVQVVYEMNEPVLLNQKGFDISLVKPRDYGINSYSDTLFTTEAMIRDNPGLVDKFVKATVNGWKESFNNQKISVDYIMDSNSTLNRDHQTKFLELSQPLIMGDGKVGESQQSNWESMQDVLIRYQVMKNKIDISKAFTNRFIN